MTPEVFIQPWHTYHSVYTWSVVTHKGTCTCLHMNLHPYIHSHITYPPQMPTYVHNVCSQVFLEHTGACTTQLHKYTHSYTFGHLKNTHFVPRQQSRHTFSTSPRPGLGDLRDMEALSLKWDYAQISALRTRLKSRPSNQFPIKGIANELIML